ncbi:hypothetical protein Tco_0073547 [Tanacetum coccineum]
MANFATKHSIMTQEMVDSFCNSFYIPAEVHPTAPERGKTISEFPAEKDPAPHLTTRQEQAVKLLESHKAPFRRKLEDVATDIAYLSWVDPGEDTVVARRGEEERTTILLPLLPVPEVKPLLVWSRLCQQALVCWPGNSLLPSVAPPQESESFVDLSAQASLQIRTTVGRYCRCHHNLHQGQARHGWVCLGGNPDLASPSQLEESEGSDDSFYELATLDPSEAKRWYVPRWNITNDSLLDDGFSCRTLVDRVAPPSSQLETSEGSDDSFYELPALNSAEAKRCMDYEQLYTEFNVGAARQICLESEVRSRAEHELELKEKLKGKYDARGRLLEEKDLEILRLKSLLVEEAEKAERAETAEVVRLRGQVSALTGEVSALKSTIAQKDTDISLLDSRATYLKSALDDSKAACAEAGSLITSLTSERDRLTSEVSTLHTAFQDFKEKAEAQQEEQAQVLYNRVAELEAHVMDLAVLKCFKSSEYQGILGHALGRAVDFGMQEGLEAGYEHGVAGTPLSAVEAYNPEAARTSYLDAVRALEDVDFPLVNLLKSKKDAGMDEVLDCFILDGPLADLPEAAHLQPCLEQLSVPIHHSDDKAIVGETSLSFALLNVHSRAEGARKHAAALRQLMMEIVSNPLSSQTWVGETSTSAAPLSVEDFDEEDTDEALGSVVAIPKFEACRF